MAVRRSARDTAAKLAHTHANPDSVTERAARRGSPATDCVRGGDGDHSQAHVAGKARAVDPGNAGSAELVRCVAASLPRLLGALWRE